jgi:hypothetical protein
VPNDPGADAIQLYMSYYKDDDAKFISVYKRIKILRESGRERADIEIPIEPRESLKELAARTIHPDQKIVDFAGKPFEKVISKRRGIKFLAQAFTLPDVTVGSIIEYRYVIALPRGVVTSQFRRYPISFPFPFTEEDELTVQLPEGYVVEESPYRRKAGLSYAGYEISSEVKDHELVTDRDLHFKGTELPPEKYEELKNFFSVVQKGDEGHAVLRREVNGKVQTQN